MAAIPSTAHTTTPSRCASAATGPARFAARIMAMLAERDAIGYRPRIICRRTPLWQGAFLALFTR